MDWHEENKKTEQNDKTAIEAIYIELFKSTLKIFSQIAWFPNKYFENIFWNFSGLVVPKSHGLTTANILQKFSLNFQKTSIWCFWKRWLRITIDEKDKGEDTAVREIS